MSFDGLSPELQDQLRDAFSPDLLEKVKGAQSMEELLECVQNEGMVISDEQLGLVAVCGCPTCEGYC